MCFRALGVDGVFPLAGFGSSGFVVEGFELEFGVEPVGFRSILGFRFRFAFEAFGA